MRSFRFRLEPILTVRSYKAKQAEIELARITGECLKIEGEIAELGHSRNRVLGTVIAAEDISYRVAQGRHVQFLEQRIAQLHNKRGRLEPERLAAQAEYNELSKKEKVLDKLKERRSLEYYREVLRDEGLVSDESASQIHVMRSVSLRRDGEGDE